MCNLFQDTLRSIPVSKVHVLRHPWLAVNNPDMVKEIGEWSVQLQVNDLLRSKADFPKR